MNQELSKPGAGLPIGPLPEKALKELAQFSAKLNEAPPEGLIQKNKFAGNSDYLPISFMEQELDRIFNGLWQVTYRDSQIIANEIKYDVDLSVFHPILGVWITRTGSGACPIQTSSGSAPSVENKIPNTLGKDAPHAKAMAFKNACKTLGVRFGRDLNRKDPEDYMAGVIRESKKDFDLKGVKEKLQALFSEKEVNEYYRSLQGVFDKPNKELLILFNSRKYDIKQSIVSNGASE
jgi:hypothetical protein